MSTGEAPPDPANLIADGQLHALDPRTVQAERVASAVGWSILLLPALGVSVGLMVGFTELWWGFAAAFAALLLLALFLVVAWPRIAYRHRAYRVKRDGIEIRRGVLWRSETWVPRSRVQHTDVNQGPIERSFGLSHLVIHTAGTQSATVTLEGLERSVALRIRDHLGVSVGDDAV